MFLIAVEYDSEKDVHEYVQVDDEEDDEEDGVKCISVIRRHPKIEPTLARYAILYHYLVAMVITAYMMSGLLAVVTRTYKSQRASP